jgi:hypothetical protein
MLETLPQSRESTSGCVDNSDYAVEINQEEILCRGVHIDEFICGILSINHLADEIGLMESIFANTLLRLFAVSNPASEQLQFTNGVNQTRFLIVFNPFNHWILGFFSIKQKLFVILDSMFSKENDYSEYFVALQKMVLLTNLLKAKKAQISTDDWKYYVISDCAQQSNSYDCGLFTCFFAHQIVKGLDLVSCDVNQTRNLIVNTFNTKYQRYLKKSSSERRISDKSLISTINPNILFNVQFVKASNVNFNY